MRPKKKIVLLQIEISKYLDFFFFFEKGFYDGNS